MTVEKEYLFNPPEPPIIQRYENFRCREKDKKLLCCFPSVVLQDDMKCFGAIDCCIKIGKCLVCVCVGAGVCVGLVVND